MSLDTSQTVQFRGGQISNCQGFISIFFSFSSLIRKGTHLGWLDLESPQKDAPGDTHIVHFGPGLICVKIPPSLSIGHIAILHPIITATEIEMQALAIVRVHCNEGTGTGAIPII